MDITKRILIAGSIFIGISAHAAEVAPEEFELPIIQTAIAQHLPTPVAQIVTDYVESIVMYVYPGEFIRFCDLNKYTQKEIIESFGMVHPQTECARIIRRQIAAAYTLPKLDRVPVDIFDEKQDNQLLHTKRGQCLGRIEQRKHSYSWPDLHKTIACWSKITQEYRTRKLSLDELAKLMQSH